MKLAAVAVILFFVASIAAAEPWSSASSGFDMSYLDWEHGGHWAWGFQTAFGPRIVDNLYFRAKVTIPIPFFIIIGNQVNIGGELSCVIRNPRYGFAVESSLGAAWCLMWPENIIVILADGDTAEPPPQHSFDEASGLRLEALVSMGYKFGEGAVWLDLGLDHRIMNVTRTPGTEREEGSYTFTGPHLGVSADIYF
jgi:hypothetical protein